MWSAGITSALAKRTTGVLPTVIDPTFHIGTSTGGLGGQAQTDIDEVYIYDRPLTDAEVRAAWLRLGLADAGVYAPPHLAVPQIDIPPAELGSPDDPSWQWAAGVRGFIDPTTGALAVTQPEVLMVSEGRNLYLRWTVRAGGADAQPSLDLYTPGPDGTVAQIRIATDGALTGPRSDADGLTAHASLDGGQWRGELVLPMVVPGKTPDGPGILLPGGEVSAAGRISGTARMNIVIHPAADSSVMWAHALDPTDSGSLGTIATAHALPGALMLPLEWGPDRLRVGVRLRGYSSWPTTHFAADLKTVTGTDFHISQPTERTVGAHQREIWVEVPLGNPDAVALELTLTAHEAEGDRTALHAVLPANFLKPLSAELTYYRFDEELQIALRPARDDLVVRGDHATVTLARDGRAQLALDLPLTLEGTFAATADVSALKAGIYHLAGAVVDADGAALATVERDWECEEDGWEWLRSLGVVEGVLPPWTPVQVRGSVASCWGRDCDLSAGLPVSLTSQSEELLAAPMTLTARLGDEEVSLIGPSADVARRGDVAAEVKSRSKRYGLLTELSGRIEYDGLLRYQITLTPEDPRELADLTLTIPLQSEFTTLLNYTPMSRDEAPVYEGEGSFAHGLPAKDGVVWSAGFVPFLWLGNEDLGLSWMMEDDRAFDLGEDDPAIEVIRSGERTDLQISFGALRALKEPVTLDFAIQATPARPLPENWRGWRWISQTWDFEAPPDRDPDQKWFNISCYWFTLFSDTIGWPESWEYSRMGDYARYLEGKGGNLLPYMESGSVPTLSPEGARYAELWGTVPRRTADQMVKSCYGSDFAHYAVFYAEKLLRDHQPQGVYIDLVGVHPCSNTEHGCGYERDGEIRPTVPIFAARRCYQRIRGLFLQHGIEPLIITSSRWKMPHYFYADSACSGEQFYHPINTDKRPYHEIVPLDGWRAEFLSAQSGTVSVLLPAWRDTAVYGRPDETEQMLALTLQHDIEVWPIWCAGRPVQESWEAKARFGMTSDAVFHPYWRDQDFVATEAENVLIGLYSKPGAALVIVSNMTDEDRAIPLTVDFGALGLPEGATAVNPISLETISVEGGALSIEVKARRFGMVWLR